MITHCHRCEERLKKTDNRLRCDNGCSGIDGVTSIDLYFRGNELRSYWIVFDDLVYTTSQKMFGPTFEMGKIILNESSLIKMYDPIISGDYFLEFDTVSELEIKVNKMLKLKAFS